MKEEDFRGGSVDGLKKNRKGKEAIKPMRRLCETHGTVILVFESGHSDKLINLSEDALLSEIGEDGKDCMKGSAEK